MNANHARPLAAFWLLAIAAAVVTGMGLRSDGGSTVRPASPSTVTSTGAPELVLGGVLRAGPTLTGPSAPGLPTAATPGVGTTTAEVAAPRTPDATHKARTNANDQTATPVHAQATQTANATTAAGHVKGRHKKDKAKSTATTSPSAHDHGAPAGHGKGR